MPKITLTTAGDSINLVLGAAGLESKINAPLSKLEALDLVAQSGVIAGGVASNLNPAFAFPAFLISEVAIVTGTALVTIYAPEAAKAADKGKLNLPVELDCAGEVVSVLGDFLGMVSAVSSAVPSLKIIISGGSVVLTTAGIAITSLQIGPTLLKIAEKTITNTIEGVESALSSSESAAAAVLGSAWSQTEATLYKALKNVSDLFSALSSNNNANFISDIQAASTAISNATKALLGEFGTQFATGKGFTEAASGGQTNVVVGSVTATGVVSKGNGCLISSGNVVGSDPFTLSNDNTISATGTATLSFDAVSGSYSAASSVSMTGGNSTFGDLMYDGTTIVTNSLYPAEIAISTDDLPFVDISAPGAADNIQIDTAPDGSSQIYLGNFNNGMQEIADYALGGLVGDTISVTEASSGTVDIGFDINNSDTAAVTLDNDISNVALDFSFSGSNDTLEIGDASTFSGTIWNFQSGDTIDLESISVASVTINSHNQLLIRENNNSTLILQLDQDQNFSSVAVALSLDGRGGTDIGLSATEFTFTEFALSGTNSGAHLDFQHINDAGEIAGVFSGTAAIGAFILDTTNDTVMFPGSVNTTEFTTQTTGTISSIVAVPYAEPLSSVIGIADNGEIVGQFPSPNDNTADLGYISVDGNNQALDGSTQPLGYIYDYEGGLEDSTQVYLSAVNSTGEIIGSCISLSSTTSPGENNYVEYGFLYENGNYTTLATPGAMYVDPLAINDSGEVAGLYFDSSYNSYGFIDDNGNILTFLGPVGETSLSVSGINDKGEVVGYYLDSLGIRHDYIYDNGVVTSFGSFDTADENLFLSDNGVVAGTNFDSGGFIYSNGTVKQIISIIPGSTSNSYVAGVNASGEVVGFYRDSTNLYHGFIENNGLVTLVNVPGASNTFIYGLNDAGEIYGQAETNGTYTSFFALPSSVVSRTAVSNQDEASVTQLSADKMSILKPSPESVGISSWLRDLVLNHDTPAVGSESLLYISHTLATPLHAGWIADSLSRSIMSTNIPLTTLSA